jgi:16S rRNA (adenine1518-N6/adenine1519-N6)-dimethyltransferase
VVLRYHHLFWPPPKVKSAVVVIERHPADPAVERAIALAAAGFGQRRKMVRSSLRGLLGDPERVIAAAGLDATDRAEDLAPEDWLRLAGGA